MKISARNVLKGKVKAVEPGAVNTEVIIELVGGQEIVSIITKLLASLQNDGKPYTLCQLLVPQSC